MPSMHPHISVVVPAYNEREFLPACLEALSKQTTPPDVVYVVDNNSTDETAKIASQYTFVTLLTESTQGICATTKTGFDTASTHDGLILRCDADSRPEPDWIARVIHSFQQNPAAIAVTGPGDAYDCSPLLQNFLQISYMKPYFTLVGLALGQRPLFGSNCALRASTWQHIHTTTHLHTLQNIHDDIDLSYHLVTHGEIIYDDTLRMPISARPFRSPVGMLRRFPVAFRSIFIHWPEQAPWRRYKRR